MGKGSPRKAQTGSQIQELLIYEHQLLKRGLTLACVDEAGRGALAGPLVAGAILVEDLNLFYNDGLEFIHGDSKHLCENSRFWAFDRIKDYFKYSVGISTNDEIDEFGIVKATKLAMKRALENLKGFDIVLVDYVPLEEYEHIAITKGDEKSFCIRLASLVAKTYRDNLMIDYEKTYKRYSFSKHKGYGTKKHLEEIKTFGISDIHRRSFCYNI